MKGQFICFEGIDGSGKSTIASQLFEQRKEKNNVIFLDKKNVSQIKSEFVRRQLTNIKASLWDYPKNENISEMGDYHWLMLLSSWFSAIADSHIKPILETGTDVIVDNWIYKFQVRFSLKEQFTSEFVSSIFEPILKPDKVILLDLDASVAFSRRASADIKPSEAGRCDGEIGELKQSFINYQDKVRSSLLNCSRQNSWRVLDSEKYSAQQIVVLLEEELFD